MLVLLVIVVLIILSLMFGGFQKGTKPGGLAPVCAMCTSAPIAPGQGGPAAAVSGIELQRY